VADMGIDLTGGLNASSEYFLAVKPDDPETRDSASLWVMPDNPEIAAPRITIDAIASDWEHPRVQLNLVHADGRAFRLWSGELAHGRVAVTVPGSSAKWASNLGAGPLQFECIEPFKRWKFAYRGSVGETTTQRQIAGQSDSRQPRKYPGLQ